MKILEELPLKTKINTIEKNMRDIGLIWVFYDFNE